MQLRGLRALSVMSARKVRPETCLSVAMPRRPGARCTASAEQKQMPNLPPVFWAKPGGKFPLKHWETKSTGYGRGRALRPGVAQAEYSIVSWSTAPKFRSLRSSFRASPLGLIAALNCSSILSPARYPTY